MLSDERIRELACVHMEGDVDRECERAIRLTVAEAVEECAVVCDKVAGTYDADDYFRDHKIGAKECADVIREKAKAK